MKKPEEYFSSHLVDYEKPERIGYCTIPILEFLKNKPWDEICLAYVHSMNPSCIRVLDKNQFMTCDSVLQRITVYLENEKINKIMQEVEVWLPEGITHGQALQTALKFGKNSKKVKWYLDAESYSIYNDGKKSHYYKHTKDGKTVEYPD